MEHVLSRVISIVLVLAAALGLHRPGPADSAPARPVKEFSIAVAETEHELFPGGPKIQAWAFNGQVPGPGNGAGGVGRSAGAVFR